MIRSRSFRRLMEGLSKAVSQQLQSKEKRSADQGKLGKVYKSTKKFICCKSFICELYLRLLYILNCMKLNSQTLKLSDSTLKINK